MAASLVLGVRFTAASAGSGSFVDSAAVGGYRRAVGALVNGKSYRYRAESADLSEWEWGTGVWNSGTSTLTRTVTISSTGSTVSFTAAPQVAITIEPGDVLSFTDAQTFSAPEKAQAQANLGLGGAAVLNVGTAAGTVAAGDDTRITGSIKAVKSTRITANTTFVPDPFMLFAIVECVGGGGGGGGINTGGSNSFSAGGGTAGSYSRSLLTAAAIGASQSVTIGAAGAAGAAGGGNGGNGGTTSFGSLCTAPGGGGGTGNNNDAANWKGPGASGGVGTGNVAAFGGAPGTTGPSFTGTFIVYSGGGGSSPFGSGGVPVFAAISTAAGLAGSGNGSGGSGACSVAPGAAQTAAGGAGTAGLCVVTQFCTQ